MLFNNAADTRFAPFAEMDLESWRYAMRLELDLVFHTTHPAWKYLLDGGGSVINTASMTSLRGMAHLGRGHRLHGGVSRVRRVGLGDRPELLGRRWGDRRIPVGSSPRSAYSPGTVLAVDGGAVLV